MLFQLIIKRYYPLQISLFQRLVTKVREFALNTQNGSSTQSKKMQMKLLFREIYDIGITHHTIRLGSGDPKVRQSACHTSKELERPQISRKRLAGIESESTMCSALFLLAGSIAMACASLSGLGLYLARFLLWKVSISSFHFWWGFVEESFNLRQSAKF